MINFTVSSAGQTLINNATAGSNPVIIDSIDLKNSQGGIVYTVTENEFAGAVVADSSNLGDYIVFQFEDSRTNSYTVASIEIKSGTTVVAISETISLTKSANSTANFRISAQFDGASKCGCKNTNINLPYATQYRDGIIRLARSSDEAHKERTVYSAQDVEALIAAGVDGSDKYVPWDLNTAGNPVEGHTTVTQIKIVDNYDEPDPESTVTIYTGLTESEDPAIMIDKYISGEAVVDTPSYTDMGIGNGYALINENYISELYSNEVTDDGVPTNKLVSGTAVSDYVAEQLESIDDNYVHIAGAETITGAKTFSAAAVFSTSVSSPSYIGTGVYSTYAANTWSNTNNNAKLPTVATVRSAISAGDTAVTNAFQTADSGLQSQIDALNAGQNLADIVATKAALDTLSITNLQTGDKVQVLADETHDGASTVYNLTSTDPKTWAYIGKYGQDSYTKSEADNLFVENSQIKQSVDSTKQDEIPSSSAVATYVTNQISTASGDYVKLNSNSVQNITSDLDITGQVDIDNVTISGFNITGSYVNTSGNPYSYELTTGSPGNSDFNIYRKSNGTVVSSLSMYDRTIWLNNGIHNISFASDTSGQEAVPDVNGTLVASWQSISSESASLSDGRLVTVDYMNAAISASTPTGVAYLAQNNTFTGNTNTFKAVSATSYTGTGVYSTYSSTTWANTSNNAKIPTLGTVRSAIEDAKSDTLTDISTENEIGSIGLFLYTEVGAQKTYGETVSGTYLKPVGMSLPNSGQISYKSVATTNGLTGTWKLLSVAMKRTATEPCLVLAQKIS